MRSFLSFFFALTLVSCTTASINGMDPDRPIEPDPPPAPGTARLAIVGPNSITMPTNSETTLSLRYELIANSSPVVGTVTFALSGDTRGATFGGPASVLTDQDGAATMLLRSGNTDALFNVTASAPGADPVSISVSVTSSGNFTSLNVTPTFAGDINLHNDIHVALFPNYSCGQFSSLIPTPLAAQSTIVGQAVSFNNVNLDAPNAVYAIGYNFSNNPVSFRCVDVASANETAELMELNATTGGVFQVEESFDLTVGLPGTVDFILNMLNGLATNPGAWVVDVAIDALGGDPNDCRSGNLVARYLCDWRSSISMHLNSFINDLNYPGYVDDILQAGRGIDEILTNVTLEGTLTLGEDMGGGMSIASHRIRLMRLIVDEMPVERPINQTANNIAVNMSGGQQSVAEHTFGIPFGEILQRIINDIVLPRVTCPMGSPPGCVPARSLSALIQKLVNCDSVASYLVGEDSDYRGYVEDGCRAAVRWAANEAEERLVNLLGYDTLHLSMSGMTIDDNNDLVADRVEGTATGRWTGVGTLEFPGSFRGARQNDSMNQSRIDMIAMKIASAL